MQHSPSFFKPFYGKFYICCYSHLQDQAQCFLVLTAASASGKIVESDWPQSFPWAGLFGALGNTGYTQRCLNFLDVFKSEINLWSHCISRTWLRPHESVVPALLLTLILKAELTQGTVPRVFVFYLSSGSGIVQLLLASHSSPWLTQLWTVSKCIMSSE